MGGASSISKTDLSKGHSSKSPGWKRIVQKHKHTPATLHILPVVVLASSSRCKLCSLSPWRNSKKSLRPQAKNTMAIHGLRSKLNGLLTLDSPAFLLEKAKIHNVPHWLHAPLVLQPWHTRGSNSKCGFKDLRREMILMKSYDGGPTKKKKHNHCKSTCAATQ